METAFDFYSIMSELQQRMLDGALFGPEDLIQEIFAGPEFDLRALRTKHCNSPEDLRPTLKSWRSLNSAGQNGENRSGTFSAGFLGRRATSVTLERRNSATDAETDITNLKKKYEEYKMENENAQVSLNYTAILKQNIAMRRIRRGSIFGENEPHLPTAKTPLTNINPFKFPLKAELNVCRIGDNYLPASLSQV
jgi:hypothetical protein